MTNAMSRVVSALLCLALIWTAPGSAAHAAAGSALRSGGGPHGPKAPAPVPLPKLGIQHVGVPFSYGTQAGWRYAQPANQPKAAFGLAGLGESLVSAITGGRPSARVLSIEAARDTARAAAVPGNAAQALARAFDNAQGTRLQSSDLPGGPEADGGEPRRLSGERARVSVTILAPPVPGGPERVLQVLREEFDFRVDEHTPVKRHWGTSAITYVGHVPVENVERLRARSGVIGVADAPRRTLEPAPVSGRGAVTSSLFHHWFHDGLSRRTPISAMVGIGLVLGSTALFVAPVALAAVAATTGFSTLPGLFALPTLWAAGNAAGALVSLSRWRQIVKTLPQETPADTGAIYGTTTMHTAVLLAQSAAYLLAGVAPFPSYFLLGGSTWLLTGLLRQASRPLAGPAGPGLEPENEDDGTGIRSFVGRLTSRFSRREPFVPAMKKVLELEALAKSDPAAAFAKAKEHVESATERRREVKLAALRVIDDLPLPTTLGFYRETLERLAGSKIQAGKRSGRDSLWYVQRNILAKLTREAQALKDLPPEAFQPLLAAVTETAKDRNASVRLSARLLLTRLGVDPGPEPDYGDNALAASEPTARPADREPATLSPQPRQPQQGNPVMKWVLRVMWFTLPLYVVWILMGPPQTAPPPKAPTAVEQVVKAPEPKAPAEVRERTDQDRLDEIAKNTDRNAKATERIAKSIEQIGGKMNQGGGFFSGIGGMVLSAIIFIAIFMLVQRFFMNRGGGAGGSGIGPNNSMNSKREKPDVRFSDVEGMDETIVEVEELVDFMRDPKRFKRMGMRMPKGLLFEGPPGTGKTMLAKAMAGEINANFFAVSGSEFVELYVGQGAARVRKLFADAKKAKPAVIFIDEIDAVGKKRGVNVTGGNDEREQTLNQILTEMQGFEDGDDIIVVAATNRMDTLDDALLRPGRFDYKVHVGKPNMNGREAILTVHSGKKPLAPDVDLRFVARRTTGLAGAELEGIMNHAAKFALRRGGDSLAMEDIDRAIDTVTIGDQRNLLIPDALKKRIAYHEAGHALASLLHEKAELRRPVNKFTIIPRDRALGFAEIGDTEGDRYLYTKSELEARIDVMLGGMVAEKMLFGEWSTGPDNDLERATQMARTMVERLGMSETMGLAQTVDNGTGRRPFGDQVGDRAHAEVNRIIKESFARVEARLGRNRHVLDALVKAVYEKETLLEEQINEEVKKAGPVYP